MVASRNSEAISAGVKSQLVPKVRGLKVITNAGIALMDEGREKEIKKAFGERLRTLRKQKGLAQETLALSCNLDRTYIGGVERGERNISLINMVKLSEALSVSTRDLFDD